MRFKKFIEALNFNSPQRANMAYHPLVQGATVGLEIEFACAGIPFNQFRPEWLAMALTNADDYKEEVKQTMYKGQNDIDDIDLDPADFENYIRQNKKEAYDYYRRHVSNGELNFGRYDTEWKETITEYWSKPFIKAIDSAGFTAYPGSKSTQASWAIGDDGYDSMYNIPVIEIRSKIITMKELPKLGVALANIVDVVRANKQDLLALDNTGIHIHVHNSKVGRTERGPHYDMFSRLAAAAHTDENQIWDSQTNYQRDFQRYALMNRQDDFEKSHGGSAHDQIIQRLNDLRQVKKNANPVIVSNADLWNFFSGTYDRNKGTNIVSDHPTVEYRYLTSQILLESNGPEKIVNWVKYFVDNTAGQVTRNRIVFNNRTPWDQDTTRVMLTRMPGDMVRIDYQNMEAGTKYPRVSQPGLPGSMMGRGNPKERQPGQGFQKWWDGLSPIHQADLKQKAGQQQT